MFLGSRGGGYPKKSQYERPSMVERLSLEIDTKFRFDRLFDFLVEQEIDKKKLSRFQPVSQCGQRDMERIESSAQKHSN